MVKNLSRNELKRIIQLEMKNLMDEDALFRGHNIPGNDDEYGDYSLDSMKSDCGCGSCPTCDDEYKHDSYMAKPQLAKIARYAQKLHDMIDDGEALQDWQESKIAQMAQMIGDVYHSIEYHEEYDSHDENDFDVHDIFGIIKTGNI